MAKNILIIVNFLVTLCLGIYIFIGEKEKKGYVLNQQVFKGFDGTRELEAKLKGLRKQHSAWLDSVDHLIQAGKHNNLVPAYQQKEIEFEQQERQLSEKYTADIWKEINQDIKDFGKEKGYDFIFGASGDGNLMYANEMNNLTNEIIIYINKRYGKR
jgi:outer membrane protein